ncbi:hypothetical protein [Natranaerovirga hydrolytica]|uniref:hypothetical protein n=1 Tax=Natranaerovirga hydrolytica TaxID=680378 RepID=UPI0014035394|nr:hypothetical protein [Natranaerovirga hydrolytica]
MSYFNRLLKLFVFLIITLTDWSVNIDVANPSDLLKGLLYNTGLLDELEVNEKY